VLSELTPVQKDSDSDTPPAPPPKPYASQSNSVAPHSGKDDQLAQSFQGLTVADYSKPIKPEDLPPSNQGFVGGFHPTYMTDQDTPSGHAPPPSMPIPFSYTPPPSGKQSLTMQMALNPSVQLPNRPPSAPSKLSSESAPTTPGKPKPSENSATKPSGQPSTPGKSSTPSASSSPPSTPSGSKKDGQVQCSGTTKAGKQCSRYVKIAPALDQGSDEEISELNPPLERFCHQHTKELLGPSGCYARKNGEWVDFSGETSPYLNNEPFMLNATRRLDPELSSSRNSARAADRNGPGPIFVRCARVHLHL